MRVILTTILQLVELYISGLATNNALKKVFVHIVNSVRAFIRFGIRSNIFCTLNLKLLLWQNEIINVAIRICAISSAYAKTPEAFKAIAFINTNKVDAEQKMNIKYVIKENKRNLGVAKYINKICIELMQKQIGVKIASSVEDVATNKPIMKNKSISINAFLVILYSPILLIIASNIGRYSAVSIATNK